MRLNVVLTEEQNTAISERAEAERISRAEWIRRSLDSSLEPDMSPPGAEEIQQLQELTRTLEAVTAERDQALEALTRITADWDQLSVSLATVTTDRDMLKADIASRDQALADRAEEIRWLRGEVSKLNDKLTPATLTEHAGTGRKPWWMFW